MSASSKAVAAIGVLSVLIVASRAPADASQFIPLCCEIVPDASQTWRYVAPLSAGSALVTHLAKPEGWVKPVVGALNGAFAAAHAGFAWHALNEWNDGGTNGAELSALANTALTFLSAHAAWTLLIRDPDETSTTGAEAGLASALRSQRPRLLAPSAAWVGGGLGLQVRLVH